MKVRIQLEELNSRKAVLEVLAKVYKTNGKFQETIHAQGVLFDKLSESARDGVERRFEELKITVYQSEPTFIRLLPQDNQDFTQTLASVLVADHPVVTMLWKTGWVLESIDATSATALTKQLEAEVASVQVTLSDETSGLAYAVSGSILEPDGRPFTRTGFTLCVYDVIANDPVELGKTSALTNGQYAVKYHWKSTQGRNGPHLLVRLFDAANTVFAEAEKTVADVEEIINLTVKPQKYFIRAIVVDQATDKPLTGVEVITTFSSGGISETVNAQTNVRGRFNVKFDETLFTRLPQPVKVSFQLTQDNQPLITTATIADLQLQDYSLNVPVTQVGEKAIKGRAVLSPEWELGVLIEAFADENLEQRIGSAQVNVNGQFLIPFTEDVQSVWFRWSQGEHQGRSPKLQPFSVDTAIRLHVYRPWRGPAKGKQRYQASIQSTSGRAVTSMPVSVMEVTLKRCQTLGTSLTNDNGTAVVFYDVSSLFMDKPDLRMLVFDANGTPLLESTTARGVIPGKLARTKSQFTKVAKALQNEEISDLEDPQDLQYMADRTGLSVRSVATYVAASKLATEMNVPAGVLFAIADSSAPNLEKALENAVEQDIAPIETLENLDKLIPVLDKAGKRYTTQKDFGRGSLDDYLAIQVADDDIREQVSGLILDAQSWSELHTNLEQNQLATPQLKFILDVQSVVGVDVELAKAIKHHFQNNQLHEGQDMALLSSANWEAILKASSTEWDDNLEELQTLVTVIKQRAQKRFPEKVFHTQIDRNAGQSDWARNIRDYFIKYPDRNFNSPIPLLEAADGGNTDPNAIAQWGSYTAYKNIYSCTQDHSVVGHFLNSGIWSAKDLAAMSAGEFKARFNDTFEGNTVALQHTHKRARKKTVALNYAASFLPIGQQPSLCACSQCKSIFGPAAYLFELLSLFRRYDTALQFNGQSLLYHLDKQRPDIIRTHLSCPNTNIECPQIDLVNEIVEDLILASRGTSIAHNLSEGECLPIERHTQGTTEERKAIHQNPPSEELTNLLANTVFPWTLPYDYQHDRATSARDRLISKPENVLLAAWRHDIAVGGKEPENAMRKLGNSMLDLGETWVRLITESLVFSPTPIVRSSEALGRVWGEEVASAFSGARIELALLKQVSMVDYETLENVLDAAFVRGVDGEDLSIEPENFCKSGDVPYLSGNWEALFKVLDRFHRFERLRRHLGWDVGELDVALQWIKGDLVNRLYQIGILLFLQQRLRIKPGELLVLFSMPSAARPVTLRNREVVSGFEELFGPGASVFDIPDSASATSEEEHKQQIQFLTAQIAMVAGESPAVVDFVFNNGLIHSADDIANLLTFESARAQAACREAVVATWRLSQWSRRLRIDKSELMDFIRLGDLQLLRPGLVLSAQLLTDAVRLVDLVEQYKNWPVTASELCYLLDTDLASYRKHGLSASEVGADLMALRQKIQTALAATRPLPADPRSALRLLLSQLLTHTLPGETGLASLEILVRDLADNLEWGAFFGTRMEQAEIYLVDAVPEWQGVASLLLPGPDENIDKREDALGRLIDTLPDWLIQNSVPLQINETDSQFEALEQSLRVAILAELEIPQSGNTASLQSNLEVAIGSPREGITTEHLNAWVSQLISDGLNQMARYLEPQLIERATILLPIVTNLWRHLQTRTELVDWMSTRYAISTAQAEIILDQLSDPDNDEQSIMRAFVDETGAVSERLNKSTVKATFLTFSDSTASEREVLLEKNEQGLMFDWLAYPPNSALKNRPFTAELEVEVARSTLVNADGTAATLILEADGAVDIEILAQGADPIRWREPSSDQIRQIHLLPDISSETATLHIRYSTPEIGGARVLRLYKKHIEDDVLDEWQWPLLMPVMKRLHRAALTLRNAVLPSHIWKALKPATGHARNMDLNRLLSKAAIGDWLAYFALISLFKRINSRGVAKDFSVFLSGNAILRTDLIGLLNLDESELDDILLLLNVSDRQADSIALPTDITLEQLKVLLDLADLSRQHHLPVSALARWNHADYNQIYEWSLSALRVGLDQPEWLGVLTEIHDPVRVNLRDAQLDYLVGTKSDLFPNREFVSDYLLTDTQMSPCMTTSRIQFAYAAIQRYVTMAQSGRLPWLPKGKQEAHFAREWVSLRFYRLYEAEKRIQAHTENWIDPAIRPNKTPGFERFEQTLHSGPLNLNLAEKAMKEYVANLAEIAHLEPVAVITHDEEKQTRPLAFRDSELFGTHVFARTRSYPRRLYYRRRLPLPDGRWLPWQKIDAEMEGTHYLAVVIFGRLRLICADFSVARPKRMDQCQSGNNEQRSGTPAGQTASTNYEVSLSWIEREYGEWSSIRRSESFPLKIDIGRPTRQYLFRYGNFPRQHFENIRFDFNVDKIETVIYFDTSDDGGMNVGSTMNVSLRGGQNTDDLMIGVISANAKNRESEQIESNPIGDIELHKFERIRLEWPETNKQDDCKVRRIQVKFKSGNVTMQSRQAEHGKKVDKITEMNYEGTNWTTVNIQDMPVWLKVGFVAGDIESEDSWQVFEGVLDAPFAYNVVSSEVEENFESIFEVVPQSFDLSEALTIETDSANDDSFKLRIFSVPHKTTGRMKAKFRPTAAILNVAGVAGAWGNDWVSGEEFCYEYETEDRQVKALRIFSDDTIQDDKSSRTILDHLGTKSVGQELFSNEDANIIYCDERPVAACRVPYKLTISRLNKTSYFFSQPASGFSPKIFDEVNQSANEPGRTLFIERQVGSIGPQTVATLLAVTAASLVNDASAQDKNNTTDRASFKKQTRDTEDLNSYDVSRRRESIQDGFYNATNSNELWRFQTFWHPQAIGFRRVLESKGLPQLMRVENQTLASGTDLVAERSQVEYFEQRYHPTGHVDPRWPRDLVDFTLTGAFSEYNWEVFWDNLLYIAQRFDEDGQFDDADQIFSLLIDTTRAAEPGAWTDPVFFQTAPIRLAVDQENQRLSGLIDINSGRLKDEIITQIKRIRLNPYQPHLIARGYPVKYAYALQIRYIEHLIQAGEADFRRAYAGDNRTYLESASLRFDLAARILGPIEDTLPASGEEELSCYAKIMSGRTDSTNNEIEQLEAYLPDEIFSDELTDDEVTSQSRLRFCVPPNDKLNELRVLVAERLLQLHSCQNIDGVSQALSLYGRRIDPALLVRATAEGIDLDILLGRISSGKPTMNFQACWQRALQACERARSLEDTWISAKVQTDSEEMSQLQNEQEIRLLEAQEEVVSQRLEDARKLKEAMIRTIESAEIRFQYYSSRERMNMQEKAEGAKLAEAGKADGRAADDSRAASDWAWTPTAEIYTDGGFEIRGLDFSGFTRAGTSVRYRLGGETAVQVYRSNAEGHRNAGAEARVEAGLMGRQGSFDRRWDDYKHNAKLAQKDRQKSELDLAGTEIREMIAELELDLHKQRLNDAKTIRNFLRDKFTSREFHSWRASRLQRLRYNQHRIAYDLVLQAKAALTREHGLEDESLITDTWVNKYSGVGAAAGLLHELEKLQQRYMETWRREKEKLKIYSLVERDPLAYLELLQRGETICSITEVDYDEDGDGDYFRRFRHVSLDIPAVRGPYANVNASLTQLRGECRIRPYRSEDSIYYRDNVEDSRFRDDLTNGECIVTNTAIQDDGRVTQQQDSEHLRPFEMNGAISTFRIELKPEVNHFDRLTATDIIIRATISSRSGGETAASTAAEERKKYFANHPRPVMIPLHSSFSNEWHQFINALEKGDEADLVLKFEKLHIPGWLQPASRIVKSNLYFSIPEGQPTEGQPIETVNEEIGTFSMPKELQPIGNSTDDDIHIPPPMHRLKLNDPLEIGRERILRFRKSGEAVPKKGWLICWVKGAGLQ